MEHEPVHEGERWRSERGGRIPCLAAADADEEDRVEEYYKGRVREMLGGKEAREIRGAC